MRNTSSIKISFLRQKGTLPRMSTLLNVCFEALSEAGYVVHKSELSGSVKDGHFLMVEVPLLTGFIPIRLLKGGDVKTNKSKSAIYGK